MAVGGEELKFWNRGKKITTTVGLRREEGMQFGKGKPKNFIHHKSVRGEDRRGCDSYLGDLGVLGGRRRGGNGRLRRPRAGFMCRRPRQTRRSKGRGAEAGDGGPVEARGEHGLQRLGRWRRRRPGGGGGQGLGSGGVGEESGLFLFFLFPQIGRAHV